MEDTRKSLFFIACFERVGTDEKTQCLDLGDCRTFGFKETFEQAERALNENTCDMHEFMYKYAIIEEMKPAIHPDVENRWFFAWDNARKGFFRIEEPKEFEHCCNITLG